MIAAEKTIIVVCILLACLNKEAVLSIPVEESLVYSTTTPKPLESCHKDTPCGWAVYKKDMSRDIDYYIKNQCLCPEGQKCYRDRDDITTSAFVYMCSKARS